MHKTFTTLSLTALLITAGPALAGPNEWGALNTAGVQLNKEVTADILNAKGEEAIAAAMAKVVSLLATSKPYDQAAIAIKRAVNTMVNIHPAMAVAIITATSTALADSSGLVASVVEGAVEAAPNQSRAIANAAKSIAPNAALAIDNAASNALSAVVYKQNAQRNAPQPESDNNSSNSASLN